MPSARPRGNLLNVAFKLHNWTLILPIVLVGSLLTQSDSVIRANLVSGCVPPHEKWLRQSATFLEFTVGPIFVIWSLCWNFLYYKAGFVCSCEETQQASNCPELWELRQRTVALGYKWMCAILHVNTYCSNSNVKVKDLWIGHNKSLPTCIYLYKYGILPVIQHQVTLLQLAK